MSNFRTEINIPVTRDARTFEQRRKDMLTDLERNYSRPLGTNGTKTEVAYGSDTSASTLVSDSNFGGPKLRSSGWDSEVNRWIRETRRGWEDHMRKTRQSMFALEPVDEFDLDNWGRFDSLANPQALGDPSQMMEQMERRMQSLRQKMDSMSPFGAQPQFGRPSGGMGGMTSIQTSSSRITTSTSTSSGNDPRGMITKSNVVESTQHSRTVNGETTSTSSQSSSSTTSAGPDGNKIIQASGTPGTLLAQPSTTSGMMNFLKDAYEIGDDGQVHFKVRFDAKDFAPEDIEVTTADNRLTVHAKKAIQSGSSQSTREFCRTIDLPRSIDHEHFQCHLTGDGVLILDAPVKTPDYQSITFDADQQLGIRPRPGPSTSKSTQDEKDTKTGLVIMGRSAPTILKDGANGRKLHLEVSVPKVYKADELCVRMDANRIIVSGKHTSSDSNTPSAEFSESYEIPETVDPFTVNAQLIDSTLVIEAPLLCTV